MEDLCEYAIDEALKAGCDYVECRAGISEHSSFLIRNGILEGTGHDKHRGISVRVLIRGGIGFASTNILTRSSIREITKEAIKIARGLSSYDTAVCSLSKESFEKAEWFVNVKVNPFDIDIEEKVNYMMHLEDLLKDLIPSLPVRIVGYSDHREEGWFINSEGANIHRVVYRVKAHYTIIASEAGDFEERTLELGSTGGWEYVKDWQLFERARHDAEILVKILREAKSPPKGIVDVVLSPELVGIAVHESCGHPFEADRILGREAAQAGESYANPSWIGKRIGSEVVTIVDDPLLEGSYGFYVYDDEGVRARRRCLVKNGTVKEFLHNRATAFYFNTNSNAAARATGFNYEPIVRMANTFMLPGDYTFDELLEDINRGVLIVSFTEWNIDDLRWNQKYVGCEAYLIDKGEVDCLIRRPALEITTKGLYSSIDACSKDLELFAGLCGKGDPIQLIPVSLGGPYARLRSVRIS